MSYMKDRVLNLRLFYLLCDHMEADHKQVFFVFFFFLAMGSYCAAQAGLELLGSSDPPP